MKSLYNFKVPQNLTKITHSVLTFTFQILWQLQKTNLTSWFENVQKPCKFYLYHHVLSPMTLYKNTSDCCIFDPVDKLFDSFNSFHSIHICIRNFFFYFNRSTALWGDVLWSGVSGLWACILRMPMSRSDLDLIFFLRGLGEHSITTCTRIHSNDWVKFGPISLGIFKSLTVLSNWKIDGRPKMFWFRPKSSENFGHAIIYLVN